MTNQEGEFFDIPGFERYQINKEGIVISKDKKIIDSRGVARTYKGKILRKSLSTTGYPTVSLLPPIAIHRLLAITFIPNPNNKPEVNHKNGIRTDNRIENLEWVTRTENQIHSWRFLNRQGTWLGKTGFMHHSGRPVNQYDVDGNLIMIYGSASWASKSNGWHHYTVEWAIKKKNGYYKGFCFTYAS